MTILKFWQIGIKGLKSEVDEIDKTIWAYLSAICLSFLRHQG